MILEQTKDSIVHPELICNVEKRFVDMQVTKVHSTFPNDGESVETEDTKASSLDSNNTRPADIRGDSSANSQTSAYMSDVTVDLSVSTSGSDPKTQSEPKQKPKPKPRPKSKPKSKPKLKSKAKPKPMVKTTNNSMQKTSNKTMPKIKRKVPKQKNTQSPQKRQQKRTETSLHKQKKAPITRISKIEQRKLYDKSSAHSLQGKQRRLEIERRNRERAAARNGDAIKQVGKLSLERADSMYKRGVEGIKDFNSRISKLRELQEAQRAELMKRYGKISVQQSTHLYDQGIEFRKRIEKMQKEGQEKREDDVKKLMNPAFKGKISIEAANRTYKRLMKHQSQRCFN